MSQIAMSEHVSTKWKSPKTSAKSKRSKSSSSSSKHAAKRVSVVTKVVKQTLQQQAEKKCAGIVPLNKVHFNSTISASGDVIPLLPPVAQGIADEQRIGNTIRPTKLVVKVCVSQPVDGIFGFTDLYSPAVVRVMMLSSKRYKYTPTLPADVATNQLPSLLHLGQVGTENIPFNGNVFDTMLAVNPDAFQIHDDRCFSIVPNIPNTHAALGTTTATSGLVKNFYSYEVDIKLPKLTFQDDGNSYPANSAPFLLIGYAYPDGSAADAVASCLIATCTSHLYYTDV